MGNLSLWQPVNAIALSRPKKKLSLINEFNEALQAAMVRVGTEEQN